MGAPANTLDLRSWSTHRIVAPVAADAAPDAEFPHRRGLINCNGYRSILVSPRLVADEGDASPTVTLQLVAYDVDKDDFTVLTTTAALGRGASAEVVVNSARVFFLITEQTGDALSVELRIKAGEPSVRSEA